MSYSYLLKASKIVCIGRNYVAHIKELNNQAPKEPFFFLKPPSSFLTTTSQEPILIPKNTVVHHEIELAVVLGKDLKLLGDLFSNEDVLEAIDAYALALDLTARSIQDVNKAKGLPWTIAKGFDTFLPISKLIPKEKIPDPYNVQLNCSVNGELKQQDLTSLMVFDIKKILVYMSNVMTLKKGDIILTGTPKGVGPVAPGDVIKGWATVDGNTIEESKMEFLCEENPGSYVFSKENL